MTAAATEAASTANEPEGRARMRAARIYDTTRTVLERAKSDGVPTATAADRMAEQRMREIGQRGIWLRS